MTKVDELPGPLLALHDGTNGEHLYITVGKRIIHLHGHGSKIFGTDRFQIFENWYIPTRETVENEVVGIYCVFPFIQIPVPVYISAIGCFICPCSPAGVIICLHRTGSDNTNEKYYKQDKD
jgi:hypothetical protein